MSKKTYYGFNKDGKPTFFPNEVAGVTSTSGYPYVVVKEGDKKYSGWYALQDDGRTSPIDGANAANCVRSKTWIKFPSNPFKKSNVFKTTWTKIQDTPGIYLQLPGSNSVWAGFKSRREAEICQQVLPEWKLIERA